MSPDRAETATALTPSTRTTRARTDLGRESVRFAPLWISYVVMILFFIVISAPIVWLGVTALRTTEEYQNNPIGLPTWHFSNFAEAWQTANFTTYVPNSIIYTASIVMLVLVLASAAGYGLARFPFPGRTALLLGLVVALTIPFTSVMFSVYDVINYLHLLNTRAAIILVAVSLALPFATFYMRTFFLNIPEELSEAARMDGAGEIAVFFRVMLPLARPGLSTLAVFTGVWTWGMYLEPLLLATDDSLRTVSLGLSFFSGEYGGSNQPLIAAAIVIIVLPLIAVSVVLQRRFVEGMTAGAVKN